MTTPASIAFGCETTAMRSITRGRRGYTTASRMAPMVTGGHLHRARSSTNKLLSPRAQYVSPPGLCFEFWPQFLRKVLLAGSPNLIELCAAFLSAQLLEVFDRNRLAQILAKDRDVDVL
jgi:hypothetical protein